MGSILKLPCTRFVRQVSNGVAMSKYGYNGMMQKNAEAIKSAPWRKAVCSSDDVALTVNKVTETDGVWDAETGTWAKKPTFSAYMKDHYDCFKQGGDAVKELATFCGYLGMCAYRFTLPTENPGAIEELRLMVQRDRYLRSGVRIAIEINSSASPSDDWATIRGEKTGMFASPSTSSDALGVASWGFLGQSEVPWLLAGRALDGTLEVTPVDFAGLADAATAKYLWVYMSIEDAADHWNLYSSTEERYYSIEGSAALVASCCEFAFSTDAVAPESGEVSSSEMEFFYAGDNAWPSHVIPWVLYDHSSTDQLHQAACRFGRFALCRGLSGLVAAGPSAYSMSAIWSIMSKSAGEFLFDTFDRSKAAFVGNVGSAEECYKPSQMLRFCGIPISYGGSATLSVLIRACDWGDEHVNGIGVSGTSQIFLGSTMAPVPHARAEYGRIRILDDMFDAAKAENCRVSINFWKSDSASFFGGFPNVALQSLASNPAFFTGASKAIEGSASEQLWPECVKDGNGDYVCSGTPESVTVSASAEFLGNVSLDDAYDTVNAATGMPTRALELQGVKIKPGDVVILSPKVDAVMTDDESPAAHWGLRFFSGESPLTKDMSKGGIGVHPYFQFA